MNDLRLLRNFIEVYESGSFRAAANNLGVAQSSVTKRIQTLESELGMRLFNRTTRAVEPTDGARRLIGSAEAAIRSAQAFQQEARLLSDGEVGAIRVGAIALAAETLIVDSLVRLAKSHPGLEVEIIVGGSDIYYDLATGKCDLVVGDEANLQQSAYAGSLRTQRICDERLVFLHRRNHPAKLAQDVEALLAYPLAIPSRYFDENKVFAAFSTLTSRGVAPRYRLNSLSACLALAAASDVVTLGPGSLIDRPALNGKRPAIVASRLGSGIELRMVAATAARNQPTPAVRAFLESLNDSSF